LPEKKPVDARRDFVPVGHAAHHEPLVADHVAGGEHTGHAGLESVLVDVDAVRARLEAPLRGVPLAGGPAGDQHRVVRVAQLVECWVQADRRPAVQLDPQGEDRGDLGGQHVAWEFLGRGLVMESPARLGLIVEYHDRMPLLPQEVRGRETRGTGPNDRHPFPARGPALGQVGTAGGQVGVGHESLEAADRHGPIGGGPAAALLARFGTHPAQHRGQGDRPFHRDDRVAEALRRDLAEHRGDVHVGWAGEVAGSQAVAQMVAQEQFQCRAADLVNLLGLTLDLHPFGGCRRAGRNEPLLPPHLHHADETRRGRLVALEMAKRGDIDPQHPGGGQHRGAGRDLNGFLVDGDVRHGRLG
jgi:hypothetical protein